MLLTKFEQCRACRGNLTEILDLGFHYLHGSFVFSDYQPPTRKIPLVITKCDDCGLIQQKYSIHTSILYTRYGYRSSTNDTMRKHLAGIVTEILRLKNNVSKVLDIGQNDGFMLSCYPSQVNKYGVDPCNIKSVTMDNHTFINDTFPSERMPLKSDFDVVHAIACFYDIDDPIFFLKRMLSSIKRDGIGIIEVAYWPDKMAKNALDEFCQEHVAFYNFENIEDLLNKAGAKVIRVVKNNINGGSIQVWFAHKCFDDRDFLQFRKDIDAIRVDEFNQNLHMGSFYFNFSERINELRKEVLDLFDNIDDKKETVHLFAASTKGNVALQFFGLTAREIPFCSERNPEKIGGYTLGTHIKMISEEDSRALKPDYYFVTNWAFKDEIIQREQEYIKGGGKLIFCFPKLEVYPPEV